MKSLVLVLLGLVLCLGLQYITRSYWGFSAQNPEDYKDEKPLFDIRKVLNQDLTAQGLIYDYTGRVNIRFTARMNGKFNEQGGVIDESFVYSDGRTDIRQWTITMQEEGRFSATAADIIGEAKGEQKGNSAVLRYKLKLPERAGGHILDVTDWMYLMEDGIVINRSEMRKFGVKVAELIAYFKKSD